MRLSPYWNIRYGKLVGAFTWPWKIGPVESRHVQIANVAPDQ